MTVKCATVYIYMYMEIEELNDISGCHQKLPIKSRFEMNNLKLN